MGHLLLTLTIGPRARLFYIATPDFFLPILRFLPFTYFFTNVILVLTLALSGLLLPNPHVARAAKIAIRLFTKLFLKKNSDFLPQFLGVLFDFSLKQNSNLKK